MDIKTNPFLELELILYQSRVKFAHVCPDDATREFRRNEFWWHPLTKGDPEVRIRAMHDYVFLTPKPSGCCYDHVSILLVEDEARCRALHPHTIDEVFHFPAPLGRMGAIGAYDARPELGPSRGAFSRALEDAVRCHKPLWSIWTCVLEEGHSGECDPPEGIKS